MKSIGEEWFEGTESQARAYVNSSLTDRRFEESPFVLLTLTRGKSLEYPGCITGGWKCSRNTVGSRKGTITTLRSIPRKIVQVSKETERQRGGEEWISWRFQLRAKEMSRGMDVRQKSRKSGLLSTTLEHHVCNVTLSSGTRTADLKGTRSSDFFQLPSPRKSGSLSRFKLPGSKRPDKGIYQKKKEREKTTQIAGIGKTIF